MVNFLLIIEENDEPKSQVKGHLEYRTVARFKFDNHDDGGDLI